MEQIWWGRVPNAMALTSDVVRDLLDEKSLVLQYSAGLPWRDYLIEYIQEQVMQHDSSKRFENIKNVENPGIYLLKEFCKPEKRAQYRPTKSLAQFFAESDDIVLHERYFWVTIDSADRLDAWETFVSDYIRCRGKGKDHAAFVLEWQGEKNIRPRKGIRIVAFDDYIGDYDRIVFSTLAASSIQGDPIIKMYLTELTAAVVGNDIELAAECLQDHQHFLDDAYLCVERIVSEKVRSDGKDYEFLKSQEEVEKCVWMAQIKTIYPLIEKFRGEFVERHAAVILRELPITSSYGENYESPADVELGTLVYMSGIGRLQLQNAEYERLKRFKEARNRLSHLNILSYEEVLALSL